MAAPLLMGAEGDGCNNTTAVSTSGVNKADVKVQTGPDGHTNEQRNVIDRMKMDNAPGSIKHLYIMSSYSGQVLIYSTVKGKVTSSGKRLSPSTMTRISGGGTCSGFVIVIDGTDYCTQELLGDDGTYGNSIDYLY